MKSRIHVVALVGLVAALAAYPSALFGQQGNGTILGLVFNAGNGEPIRGAQVSVEDVPDATAVTNTDGQYQLSLPAGGYTVTIKAANFLPTAVQNLEVVAGETADGSAVLSTSADVTTVDVVATVEASEATAEALLIERKLAPVVSDGISGEEIRKSTASDAAGAVEKVTGVSVTEGGFVYVRGLGERYSNTMLNDAMIPTTEPERRVVPLDLFPAELLDTVKVLKTYTPDLPGEFSGGLVQLKTVEFPTGKIFRVGMSYGFNTRTTFQDARSYSGGGTDFFGFDDGTRNLPGDIPANDRVFPGRYSPDELQSLGRSFSTNWEPVAKRSMRPSVGYSIAAGNTWGKLGIVGAATFTNKPQRFSELQRFLVNTGGGQAGILTNYPDFVADDESVRLGAVANVAYRFTPGTKLVWRNTLTRETEKEFREFSGTNGRLDSVIQNQRMRWVERGLFSTGLEGEHVLSGLANSLFRWQVTYSKSNRDEPDMREVVRTIRDNGTTPFQALPQSGTRFYDYLKDHIYEPLVEWGVPFYKGSFSGQFKVGFRGTFRHRDFSARRFRFVPGRLNLLNLTDPTNVLLGPDNITPDLFQLRENTRGTDQYSADMDVYGGFAMLDLSLGGKWRVVGGVRIEDANIDVETIDPLVPGSVPTTANLSNRDPLPSVNVIYALSPKQNLRFGYGRTLNRPDFRELSPFDFVNVLGGFSFAGNPDLKRATIENLDARWEWFLGGSQVIAVSYFYKNFTNPIEVTIQPTTGDLRQTYFNAAGAKNQGVEFELRKRLAAVSPKLADFAVQANFTIVDSNVQLGDEQRGLLTSLSRPMMGQSRYIYNVVGEWAKPQWRSSARVYTNYVSRKITDVGALQLPDIYQEANHFLDFVYQYDIREGGKWTIRFTAENLTDNHYHWTQADILQRSYRLGRTFSIGTSFSVF